MEYIAAVDRPGFSVWDAMIDAIGHWRTDGEVRRLDPTELLREDDRMRVMLTELLLHAPPPGYRVVPNYQPC